MATHVTLIIPCGISSYSGSSTGVIQLVTECGDLRAQADRSFRDDDPPYRNFERDAQRTQDGYTVYQGNKHSYVNKAYNPRYDDRPQDGFLDSRNQQVTGDEFMRYEWGGRIPRPRLEEYPPGRRF